jgi:hypothetical protein
MRPLHLIACFAVLTLCALSFACRSPGVTDPVAEPVIAAAVGPALEPLRELLVDGGFEGAAPGLWQENNWAKNEVEFVRDPERPFAGKFSQRMRLTRALHQANLQLLQPLTGVGAGDTLRVSLALRGLANARPIEVQIRRQGPPYTDYGHLSLPITEDWQTAAFIAVLPTETPPDLGLYVQLNEENTIWVDAVSVGQLPPTDSRPVLAGNLIPNGSFEVGSARWSANFRGDGQQGISAEQDLLPSDWQVVADSTAPQGQRVLRIGLRPQTQATVTSAWAPYRSGRPATLSFALRGDGPGNAHAALVFGEAPNLTRVAERDCPITTTWTRHELTCTPGNSDLGMLFVELKVSGTTEVRVDDVRLQQAPGPDTLQVGCEPVSAVPGNAYRGSEIPRLRVRVAHAVPDSTLTASLHISDTWGKPLARVPTRITVDHDGNGACEVELPHAAFGAFRVAVGIDGQLVAEHLYSYVPEVPRQDGSGNSFFGGHFTFSQLGLDLAERGGFRWLRLHPPLLTKWSVIEPQAGQPVYPLAPVARATARGFSVLGSLDSPPEWAATPGIAKPYAWWHCRVPRDWNEWTAYVQGVVAAFPAIRAWEVYNEPDGDFLVVKPGEDKAAKYVEILQRTQQAVEAAHANIELVGLPVSSLDRPFFRQVLNGGGAAAVDSLAFHFYYEDLDPLEKRPDFSEQLATMRAHPNRRGAVPAVWHTEGGMWLRRAPSWFALSGIPNTEGTGQLEAAHALVRTATALKALGVKHHFQYAGLTSPTGSGGLISRSECSGLFDLDGSARPSFAAHAAMVWLLDDAAPVGVASVQVGTATVRICRFTSASRGPLAVVWSRQTLDLAAVPGVERGTVRDLMGNVVSGAARLSAAPLYVFARSGQ